MNQPYPTLQLIQASSLATEQSRQRLIAAAISYKQGTSLVAEPSKKHLFDQFVRGRLTIDELVYYLETTTTS